MNTAQISQFVDHLDALQNRYIDALDSKDMHGWLATFDASDEASYILTTLDNEQQQHPLGLMLDDCRARIMDRVTYITKIWAGTFQDYRTRHFTQRIATQRAGENLFDVRTNFSVCYTPVDTGESGLLTCGVYLDRIRIIDQGAVFVAKKAVIDTSVLPQYVVYPL
jgi:3-phenylpropionate/cinnamic acid dioxygenase small subunit